MKRIKDKVTLSNSVFYKMQNTKRSRFDYYFNTDKQITLKCQLFTSK